uniref:Uncharacterized protein n=1 Tax=Klebsiella pneumoniae TaxID=573 RepID=A0A4P8WDG0_KLEPN|nr:hypothetical protein [Klebsiella pneumoniae]
MTSGLSRLVYKSSGKVSPVVKSQILIGRLPAHRRDLLPVD